MPMTSQIQQRLDALRVLRIRCRRMLKDAFILVLDPIDRRKHVEFWRERLRAAELETEQLCLLAGKTPPSQLPRIRLTPQDYARARVPIAAAGVVTKRLDKPVTLKTIDPEARIVEGVASTPTPDRLHDVVEPLGAKFSLPLALLLDHRHDQPVGSVVAAKPTSSGITVTARIAKVPDAGYVRDLTERAWHLVKHQLVRSLSIGFRGVDREPLPNGGIRWKTWEWLELSLVVVPAQPEAVISTVRAA
jgi:HK97 family phage prohead protease